MKATPDAARVSLLHPTDGRGQYRRPDKPGPNEPCECGSGKKAKRCHRDGLQPNVRSVQAGKCDGCDQERPFVIPLKHDATGDVVLGMVCLDCLKGEGHREVFSKLLARHRKALAEHAAMSTDGREATLILYRCESCQVVSTIDLPDSAVRAGRLAPRSLPCEKCHVPELPFAARRATSAEFAEVTVAVMAQDQETLQRLLGTETALGVLPGVQVKTIPFAGDVIMGAPA